MLNGCRGEDGNLPFLSWGNYSSLSSCFSPEAPRLCRACRQGSALLILGRGGWGHALQWGSLRASSPGPVVALLSQAKAGGSDARQGPSCAMGLETRRELAFNIAEGHFCLSEALPFLWERSLPWLCSPMLSQLG